MRKVISIYTHYVPVEWGIRDNGKEIVAFAHFVRYNGTYELYGDDADIYREFEEAGFTLSKPVETYKEGYDWIKEKVDNTIGG